MVDELKPKTVVQLRTILKQSGFGGKLEKFRKDELIDEICKLKEQIWKEKSKPQQMTSLQDARQKKRKNWEREVDEERERELAEIQQKSEKPKRTKMPSFLQQKEEEAQQIRTGSVKRDVPAFLRSPVVSK